jgi:hypothetical protein
VVQTKRPALLGSAKRALKNSASHLAEFVMRPQADQIGALMKFSVFLPFQKFKGSFDPRSQFLQATLIEPFAH